MQDSKRMRNMQTLHGDGLGFVPRDSEVRHHHLQQDECCGRYFMGAPHDNVVVHHQENGVESA